jgi:hypothetical protein
MIDSGLSTDIAPDARVLSPNDALSESSPEKSGKKGKKKAAKEQDSAEKSAEREQKILWDADKIQLKWVRLTILMAGIGFGADQTLHALGQGGVPPFEIWVLRAVAQSLGVIGLVALGIATFQHGRLVSALARAEPIPVARFPLSLIVAILVVVLGVVALIVSVISLGAVSRASVGVPSGFAIVGTAVVVAATATVVPPTVMPPVQNQAPTAPPVTRVSTAVPVPVMATPVVAQAATPAPTPIPMVAAATPNTVVIQGTGPAGARLRQAPVDGEIITVLADGTRLTALDETTSAGGQTWQRVRTADDREGWIAAELIASGNP